MMKAAQVTGGGGGTNNNGTPGGHSGLLGPNSNLPSTSPGPQSQNMMQGILSERISNYIFFTQCLIYLLLFYRRWIVERIAGNRLHATFIARTQFDARLRYVRATGAQSRRLGR